MKHHLVGLRTLKTALAVAVALSIAIMRESPSPIFAALGATVAMSRAFSDAVRACATQIVGLLCGVLLGLLFIVVLPSVSIPVIALGIVIVITLCHVFKLDYAIPLSCVVFVSMCLTQLDPDSNYLAYAFNRFFDTAVGLVTSLVVNVSIKPYNNRDNIIGMITRIQCALPGYLEARILKNQFPDLSQLEKDMLRLSEELKIYEVQPVSRLFGRKDLKRERLHNAVYLRGCEQLLSKAVSELSVLCDIDDVCPPNAENYGRLALLGLDVPEELPPEKECTASTVLNYHLHNFFNAYDILAEFTSEQS